MSRRIEFRNRSDASQASVVNDLAYLLLRVRHLRMKCSPGTKLGKHFTLVGETVVVDDVPMEHVEFAIRHAVEYLLQREHVDVVPRCIDQ